MSKCLVCKTQLNKSLKYSKDAFGDFLPDSKNLHSASFIARGYLCEVCNNIEILARVGNFNLDVNNSTYNNILPYGFTEISNSRKNNIKSYIGNIASLLLIGAIESELEYFRFQRTISPSIDIVVSFNFN